MRDFAKLRTALTLIVAFVVALELLHWVRPFAVENRAETMPSLVVGPDGSTWFRRHEARPGAKPNAPRMFAIDFDDDGEFFRETALMPGDPRDDGTVRPSVFGRFAETTPGARFGDLMDHRFRPPQPPGSEPNWIGWLASELTSSQYDVERRREYLRHVHDEDPSGLKRWADFPAARWTFRDGRFECVDPKGVVTGSFGPDGYASGGHAADAARFDPALTWPATASIMQFDGGEIVAALVEPVRLEVVFVSFPQSPGFDWAEPLRDPDPFVVHVNAIAVAGPHGEPPAPLPRTFSARRWAPWMNYSSQSADDDVRLVYVRAGSDLVGVRRDGTVRRAPLDPDEIERHRWRRQFGKGDGGNDVATGDFKDDVVTSVLPPLDPARPRMRVRQWRDDGTLLAKDVRPPLISTSAVVAEIVGHVPSMLRPPLLTAVSFVLPGPADFEDYSARWLLDPDVAGGAGVGWLAASLAVAAVCGAFARRQARRHCPAPRDVAFWTTAGAALGVVGIIWMEIVVRRSHVAVCACGRRRAVHVATCPACAAEWPAPAATGIEVFA